MATETDQRIFVCGVTQYAMSSGKFEADDIVRLAERARDAFVALWGQPTPDATYAPRPSPGGFQRPRTASAPQATIQPETKPFSVWGGDRAYFGKTGQEAYGMPIREVDWALWVDQAAKGDSRAKQALEIMAKGTIGDEPKWHRANTMKIARAKACLAMLQNGQFQPAVDEGPPPEITPF